MPDFRVQYKNIFLTYAQSDLVNQELLDFLWDKLETFEPTYIVVCRELHADGNPHHHALIQLAKKPNIINANYFDFNGRHPNVDKAPNRRNSTIAAAREYVLKDGDFVERGEFKNSGTKRNRDDVYAEALGAATKEEAQEIIKAGAPRDYFIASGNIDNRLRQIYENNLATPTVGDYNGYEGFINVPEAVQQWYASHVLVSA